MSHVPPGCGKPTTQRRNLRRRLKKRYAKNDEQPTAPAGSSSTNTQLLGIKLNPSGNHTSSTNATSAIAPDGEPTIFMASFRNKNKRPGFKKSMNKPLPQKIVFSVGEDAESPLSSPSSSNRAQPVDAAGDGLIIKPPRLITPSEKQNRGELPSNIFVSTVNVEEGLVQTRRERKQETHDSSDEEVDGYNGEQSQKGDHRSENLTNDISVDNLTLCLRRAEEEWESSVKITGFSELKPGQIVGWMVIIYLYHFYCPLTVLFNAGIGYSPNDSYPGNTAKCITSHKV